MSRPRDTTNKPMSKAHYIDMMVMALSKRNLRFIGRAKFILYTLKIEQLQNLAHDVNSTQFEFACSLYDIEIGAL